MTILGKSIPVSLDLESFFLKLKIKTSIDSVEEIFKTWNNPLADTETH